MSLIHEIEQITSENKEGWREIRAFYSGWILSPLMITVGVFNGFIFAYLGASLITFTSISKPSIVIPTISQQVNNDKLDSIDLALIACYLLGGMLPYALLFKFKKPDYTKVNDSDRRLSALIMSQSTTNITAAEAKALKVARKVVKGTDKSEFM